MLVLGIIIIIFAIAMMIVRPSLREEAITETDKWGDEESHGKAPAFLLWFNFKKSLVIFFLGLTIALIPYLFMYAERGYQYLLVYPNGHTDAVMSPGIKLKLFARIDPWQKYIDVKAVEEGQDADFTEIEGVMKPIGIRSLRPAVTW